MSNMIELSDAERRLADRIAPEAGTALAISPNAGGISFTNAAQAMDFAKMMALSNSGVRKHLRGNPGACLAIVVQAVEWGVSPYAVANKSYFVNDQIAFESQLVQAVILRRAPIRGRIKFEYSGSGQTRRCRAWARLREDDEVVEYTSPELKDIAVKNSPLWKADADQQMSYYSGRALCRRHFPDVLLGIYTEDDFAAVTAPGPGAARDVTPARTMVGRLDQIAGGFGKADLEAAEEKVEAADDVAAADEFTDAVHETSPANDPEDAPRDLLILDLHDAIDSGARVSKLLNELPPEKRDLLTDEDVKALHARAKKASGGQA